MDSTKKGGGLFFYHGGEKRAYVLQNNHIDKTTHHGPLISHMIIKLYTNVTLYWALIIYQLTIIMESN